MRKTDNRFLQFKVKSLFLNIFKKRKILYYIVM
nr:MAG TPA: hypothetical protein [Caudoviricetes sp.]